MYAPFLWVQLPVTQAETAVKQFEPSQHQELRAYDLQIWANHVDELPPSENEPWECTFSDVYRRMNLEQLRLLRTLNASAQNVERS